MELFQNKEKILKLLSHKKMDFLILDLKSNFLLAKKTPKVKWNKMTSEDIAAATPKPWLPYANKQIGKPILPVLGNIKGGNSLIISFFHTNKKINSLQSQITDNKIKHNKNISKYFKSNSSCSYRVKNHCWSSKISCKISNERSI